MSENIKEYLKDYSDFVTKVTSNESLDTNSLKKRMDDLDTNLSSPRLLTAALGLG